MDSGSFRIAKYLSKHDRHHEHVPLFQSPVEELCILPALPLKERNPCAGVCRHHRSDFSSANVRVKRTLPRSRRRRA
jgi:hypothetical protein